MKSHKKNFTLIELLAVITIGLILIGITLGVASYAQKAGVEKRTNSTLVKCGQLLERYRQDRGVYPGQDNADNLWETLIKTAHGTSRYKHSETKRPYIPEMDKRNSFNDGWGQQIKYVCNHNNDSSSEYNKSQSPYILWSKGPDGQDAPKYDDMTIEENHDNLYYPEKNIE